MASFSSSDLSALRITINTYNRLITDTTVSKELWLCHQKYGWGLGKIKDILVAGFKSAFVVTSWRERERSFIEFARESVQIALGSFNMRPLRANSFSKN